MLQNKKLCIGSLILEGIASVLMFFLIFRLNILPKKFLLLFGSILLIIFLLLGTCVLRVRKKNSKRVSSVINILLSIVLFVGSFFIYKGDDALRSIAGANKKVYTMSVIVLEEAPQHTISDLEAGTIVVNTAADAENLSKAMEAIKQEVSDISFSIVDNYKDLVNMLYNGEVDAILINEAYRSMVEVEDADFSHKTRVLWSHDIAADVNDVRKSVDVTNTPFTVYISGIDTYGSISTVSRTDVNMLVTVNPNTKQILMTSIPRDAWVELANMEAYDKLTHSGIEGIENSITTIENFLNIDINYYARVNFSSVVAIVDALDGIDVYSEYSVNTSSGWYIEEGMNHLYGEQALSFARERHAYDYMFEDSERGDQIRVENQQAVLQGIINKMISPAIIRNYTDILEAMEGMFETNMSATEITDLISMQLDEMTGWGFINQKITGEYEYKYGGAYMPDWELIYYVPDPVSVQACVSQIEAVLNNQIISQ